MHRYITDTQITAKEYNAWLYRAPGDTTPLSAVEHDMVCVHYVCILSSSNFESNLAKKH